VAWDAPGYGQSTAIASPAPATADYAAAALALADHLGLDRFHLVGHSLGALIAARVAADNPARIVTLTLASIATGHARLPEEERVRLRRGRLDDLAALGPRGMAEKRGPRLVRPDAPDDVRQAVIETMAAVTVDGYTRAVNLLSQGDTMADVARLDPALPVQFVFGADDVVTTPEQNWGVAALRPKAPLTVIPDAGHAVYLEQPAAFNRAIAAFVERNRAGDRI
jgi:pimeloyl-ACP methyl ester carboxylesterase